jgi:YidC/Oxa1 family membrane protein insertase
MTVLLKILLFPLTQRSLLSAAKMRVLKPEIDELKAKYADDQTKFGQEQLKLFQKAGVNPLGGCIPMLLQMPILIAMYSFFPVSIELRQQSFLWAADLSTYDSIYDLGFNIPFYGDHVSLFTLLMTISSILFAIYNNQLSGVSGQMKYMAYIFPVMLLGIFNNLPSGLTYYYFLSNVISFGQQWIIQKFFIDEQAIHRQIQENKKKTPKKSSFLSRLEEMQKQQSQWKSKKK